MDSEHIEQYISEPIRKIEFEDGARVDFSQRLSVGETNLTASVAFLGIKGNLNCFFKSHSNRCAFSVPIMNLGSQNVILLGNLSNTIFINLDNPLVDQQI